MKTARNTTRYVICGNNDEYPASLELFKIYRAIPDRQARADGDIHVVDEGGEDYLFPANYFMPVQLPRTIVRVLNKSFLRTPAEA